MPTSSRASFLCARSKVIATPSQVPELASNAPDSFFCVLAHDHQSLELYILSSRLPRIFIAWIVVGLVPRFYRRQTAEFDGLTGRIREQSRAKHLSAARLSAQETELDRLHGELERVIANDFFEAKGRTAALTAYDRCQKAIRQSQIPAKKAASAVRESGVLSVADFQNRRWGTRCNLHIDRLASAWLISRFIDKRPRFYFVGDDETIEGGIPFDMFGAEFTHQGEDCTFETLLKDDKFNRLEAAGLNAIINGLSENLHDDRKLLQQSGAIFDGLFTLFGKQVDNKKSRRSKRVSSRKTSRKK